MVYMNLRKEAFSAKRIEEANAESIAEMGEEDGKENLIFDFSKCTAEISEIDENGTLTIDLDSTEFGFISVDVKLSDQDMIAIIGLAVKRFNKVKTMLESLK